MPDTLTIDPTHSALLVMDCQSGIVAAYGTDQRALLDRATSVIHAARSALARVIYVVVGFRPGYPEISPRNASFSTVKRTGRFSSDAPEPVHPSVAPEQGDITVVKHRVSAFAGTDLEMILRANDVETLVMFGVATSGVVLSTLRHAADVDYRCVVVHDCCADRDAEVHACLVDKIFPRQATVVTAEEAIEAFAQRA